MKTLVLGGARSGKSGWAARLAARSGAPVTVIATAEAGDAEMQARIARHRAERPAGWSTVEVGWALADALRAADGPGRVVIVDCLTLWLTGLVAPLPDRVPPPDRYDAERAALFEALAAVQGEVLLVSNEVGQGVMPADALSRRFVDEAGWLHQAIAARCERVVFMAAGCALVLKGPLTGPAP